MLVSLPLFILVTALIGHATSFQLQQPQSSSRTCRGASLKAAADEWKGDVVSNTADGKIRGCTVQSVGDSIVDWIIQIDGVEADLGSFSQVIYRKITSEAKQQRFQGFRPGTIPPHLQKTYIAFAMDECARETTLEAMQQNNIRPFDDTRNKLEITDVTIPPPIKKKKKKSKKKKTAEPAPEVEAEEKDPEWLTFDNMDGAIDAGWKPGQSFSFKAKNAKGQLLKDEDVSDATPLGTGYIS